MLEVTRDLELKRLWDILLDEFFFLFQEQARNDFVYKYKGLEFHIFHYRSHWFISSLIITLVLAVIRNLGNFGKFLGSAGPMLPSVQCCRCLGKRQCFINVYRVSVYNKAEFFPHIFSIRLFQIGPYFFLSRHKRSATSEILRYGIRRCRGWDCCIPRSSSIQSLLLYLLFFSFIICPAVIEHHNCMMVLMRLPVPIEVRPTT